MNPHQLSFSGSVHGGVTSMLTQSVAGLGGLSSFCHTLLNTMWHFSRTEIKPHSYSSLIRHASVVDGNSKRWNNWRFYLVACNRVGFSLYNCHQGSIFQVFHNLHWNLICNCNNLLPVLPLRAILSSDCTKGMMLSLKWYKCRAQSSPKGWMALKVSVG